jgi:hypothetical protein
VAIDELREHLSALSERNVQPLRDVAELGLESMDDEERKARYLDALADGLTPGEAAEKVGSTSTRMRRFRNPRASRYDEGFTAAYEEIMAENGEHREALLQRLRKAAIEEALRGNARLLEKWLMILDPEWAPFKPQNFQVQVNVEQLKVMLPFASNETLDRMIREAEGAKELPPVIDAI